MNLFKNAFPFEWNENENKNLFGNLFPKGLTYKGFSETNLPNFPYNETSIPNPWHFPSYNSKQLAEKEYPIQVFESNDVKVYTDKNFVPYELPETEVLGFENRKQKIYDDFTLTLFICHDGTKILRQFSDVQPKENELILFLEINDKSNLFGSVMRIKFGDKIRNIKIPEADIIDFANNTHAVGIKQKDLIELLNYNSFNDKLRLFTNVVLKFASKRFSLVSYLQRQVGEFSSNSIADSISNTLLLSEYRWDPALKNYEPIFMTLGLKNITDQLKAAKVTPKYKLRRVLYDINLKLDEIQNWINEKEKTFSKPLPFKISRRIKEALNRLKHLIDNLKVSFEKNASGLLELLEQGHQIANAFICGILNSITEAIAGIFELIGFMLLLNSKYNELMSDKSFAFSFFIETIENIIEAFNKFDFTSFANELIQIPFKIYQDVIKPLTAYSDVDTLLKKLESSLPKLSYCTGYAIGFVIQLFLEALYTGGTKAAESVIQKLSTFLKNPSDIIKNRFKELKDDGVDTIKNAIVQLEELFELIRSGEVLPAFKQWIDNFIQEFKKALGLVDEAGEAVVDAFAKQDEIIRKVKSGEIKLEEKLENEIVSKRKPGDFTRHTNFSELVSLQKWIRMKTWTNGKPVKWKNIGREISDIDTPIEKGIDLILENELFDGSPPPPKYLINEVKYNSTGRSTWMPSLDRTITKSRGSQMTDKWIKYHLSQMSDKNKVLDILESHEAYLTGVSKTGDEFIIYQLTQNARSYNRVKF